MRETPAWNTITIMDGGRYGETTLAGAGSAEKPDFPVIPLGPNLKQQIEGLRAER